MMAVLAVGTEVMSARARVAAAAAAAVAVASAVAVATAAGAYGAVAMVAECNASGVFAT